MADVEAMATFVAVIEAPSFTEAARRIGTVKSVISRRIRNLETDLGVRLLERSAQRVRPTEVGTAYYGKCLKILAEIDDANDFVAGFHERMSGELSVSVPSAFNSTIAGPIIAEFCALHSELNITVETDERDASLSDASFDLGIRIGPLPDSSLIARSLTTSRRFICASPAYLQARGVPQTPEDLESHDALIHSYSEPQAAWSLRRHDSDESVTVRLRERLRSSCRLLLLDAARAGLGLAMLPSYVLRDAVAAGELVVVMPDYAPPASNLSLIYPQGRRSSAKVQALVSHFVDRIGGTPPWESGIAWGATASSVRVLDTPIVDRKGSSPKAPLYAVR